MKCKVFSGNIFIYPDMEGGKNEINLNVAKGSFGGAQILIKGNGQVKCYVEGNYESELNLMPAMFRLLKVNVNKNSEFLEELDYEQISADEMKKYHTKQAPFTVYDPLMPVNTNIIDVKDEFALYLRFEIPQFVTEGVYTGDFVLENESIKVKIPITIKVHDVNLPIKTKFKLVNWWGFDYNKYKCELFDERYWNIVGKIASLARYAHQNYIYIYSYFFSCKKENEKLIFDFSKVEKYIKMLLNMGYTYIEGPHITSVYNRIILPLVGCEIHSDKGYEYFSQFVKAWYNFLKENNWLSITVQHIGDEPKENEANQYKKLSDIVKSIMPGVPIIDAILTEKVLDAVDIAIPTTRHYQLYKEQYNRYRDNGGQLWLYTCCWPCAPYLNRFLDMPLLSTRFIHWLNFKERIDGYLHWGFCSSAPNQDVYNSPSVAFIDYGVDSNQFLPPGDTNIIYPTENGPIGSMRLEMLRAGIEDYELFNRLSKTNEKLADEIINLCITDNMTGIYDEENFSAAYLKLLGV